MSQNRAALPMLTEDHLVRSHINDQMRTSLRGEVPKGAGTYINILFSLLDEAVLLPTEDDVTGFVAMAIEHEEQHGWMEVAVMVVHLPIPSAQALEVSNRTIRPLEMTPSIGP